MVAVARDIRPRRMSPKMAISILVLTCFDSFVHWVEGATQSEIDQHLSMGMTLLAKGQYSDALSHFHSAIDADSSNYMSYYKRATVFLALSRSRPALLDLDKVLQLKPDFLTARLKRGNVLMKMGTLEAAHIDFEHVLRKEPNNEEALNSYSMIDSLGQRVRMTNELMQYNNFQAVVEEINELIEIMPWDSILRETRADAYVGLGNIIHAISDIRSVTKLTNDNTQAFFRLSELHYQLGESQEALNEIRECLKLDPEHKQCYPFYKKLKKVAKFTLAVQEAETGSDWPECISSAGKVLKNEPDMPMIRLNAYSRLCVCHLNEGDNGQAIKACTSAIMIQENPNIYCDRAEAYLNDDMFDEAVKDYRHALDLDGDFHRAKEGLQKTQKRQKVANKRDYYKILGVRRKASKQEINKKYRKMAQKWHPDNFQNEVEKKKAEKKFMDIAAAKEVLTDPEKRQKFDNGDDPLDPEDNNHHGQGQPFHFHGDHPFGGAQFKFHFN